MKEIDITRKTVELWISDSQRFYAGYLEPDKVVATIRALLDAVDEAQRRAERSTAPPP